MASKTIITLLTDFGQSDIYVGVIKGVIAQIHPEARTIDLTHQIAAGDVAAGRFCLMNAIAYFPRGTIHLAIVDPGVGSKRRGVAIALDCGFLVGPDNGLFSGVLEKFPAIDSVELTNSNYWFSGFPSNTFHGRDIFAPTAAYLANGIELTKLGKKIEPTSLIKLSITEFSKNKGTIQYCDRFGNLITNIPARLITEKNWIIQVGDRQISSGKTYSDVNQGELITLISSDGWVEIAVNGGSAKNDLGLEIGATVEIINLE